MSEHGSTTASGTAREKLPRKFVGAAWLLVLTILTCGVFAGLAGKEIGDKHTMFVISFIFLGLVVVEIFGLAWLDSNTRGPDQGERLH